MIHRLMLLLLAAAACATTPNQMYTAADAEPCSLVIPADTAAWQLVRARGFTFCVPADWTPTRQRSSSGIDAREWRAPGASITWSDEPERDLAPVVIEPSGGVRPPSDHMPRTGRRFRETIDGRVAELWILESGVVRTNATWTSPRVHISGEARTRELGMLQLDIYRTVRFAR